MSEIEQQIVSVCNKAIDILCDLGSQIGPGEICWCRGSSRFGDHTLMCRQAAEAMRRLEELSARIKEGCKVDV